jgi:hypothetical protein
MQMRYPTFCLHRNVFRIATALTKLMSITDQSDTKRLLTAAI